MELKRKVVRQTHAAAEITKYETADGGDKTKVTSAAHGLSDGDIVQIYGTTNYDAADLVVSESAANTFEIITDYVADDAVGMWVERLGSTDLSEDAEQFDEAVLYTDLTVYTDGTLVIGLETSPDRGATWYSLANGASLNSVSTQRLEVAAPLGRRVRPVITLGGTQEMAFTIWRELARTGG